MSALIQKLRIDSHAGLVPDIVREDCRMAAEHIEALEAALRKVDEWFYPGDSDLPYEVKLMNELHALIAPNREVKP